MKDTNTEYYFKKGKMVDINGKPVTLEIGNSEQIKALRKFENEQLVGKEFALEATMVVNFKSKCHCGGAIYGDFRAIVGMDNNGIIDESFSKDIMQTTCYCYECNARFNTKTINHQVRLFETKK